MKKIGVVAAIAVLAVVAIAAGEPYGTTTVADVSLTGQTGSTSTTTLYTPGADGDYLVTIYNSCGSGSGTSFETALDYTDEFRSYTENPSVSASSNGHGTIVALIHAASGDAIQYYTSYSGGTSACDTFVKLVKL